MNCEQARAAMEREKDGDPDAKSAARLQRHVAECPSCAAWRTEAPGLRNAIRDALTPFEPSEAFCERMRTSLRYAPAPTPPPFLRWETVARWAWIPAAAAAIAICLRLFWPAPAGQLLDGSLASGGKVLRPGVPYQVRTRGTVAVGKDIRALLPAGARFRVEEKALRVEAGGCYVQNAATTTGTQPGPRVVAGEIQAELSAATRLYVYVSGKSPSSPAGGPDLGSLLDLLVPSAYAGEEDAHVPPDDTFLVVFAGRAAVSRRNVIAWVEAGQGFFPDQTGREVQDLRSYTERLAAASARDSRALDDRIALYRRTIAVYDQDLAAKRDLRTSRPPPDIEELEIRIALVDRVRMAHQERLKTLLTDRQNMLSNGNRAQWEAQLRRIRQAQAGDSDALVALRSAD